MARLDWQVEHLLRRAAFGPDLANLARFANTSVAAVAALACSSRGFTEARIQGR